MECLINLFHIILQKIVKLFCSNFCTNLIIMGFHFNFIRDDFLSVKLFTVLYLIELMTSFKLNLFPCM